MSNHHRCTDCHLPIPAGLAVIRSISLQRVTFCKPCAEDRGLIDPPIRAQLAVEFAGVVSRGVAEAETYANGVRS